MNCPYCNSPVPFNVSQCPGCGAPVQQPQSVNQPTMPQAPIGNQPASAPVNRRNRVVYIMLGLFLGCLGIHNFYAGRNGRGATQLLITVLVGWIGGWVVTGIWALIDISTVTTDGNGVEFE